MPEWFRPKLILAAFLTLFALFIVYRGVLFGGYIVTVPNSAVWSGGVGNHSIELDSSETYVTWGGTETYGHYSIWVGGAEVSESDYACDDACAQLGDYTEISGISGVGEATIEVTQGEVYILTQQDSWDLPTAIEPEIQGIYSKAQMVCGVLCLIPSLALLIKQVRRSEEVELEAPVSSQTAPPPPLQ